MLLRKRIDEGFKIVIVSGDARGVDDASEIIAERNDWKHIKFKADWDSNGAAAGYIRNEQMYKFVSNKPNYGALLIWDGESPGTMNNFLQAYDYDVPVRCFEYMQHRWLSKDEIWNVQEKVVAARSWYNR